MSCRPNVKWFQPVHRESTARYRLALMDRTSPPLSTTVVTDPRSTSDASSMTGADRELRSGSSRTTQ
jgi:hypothetical protein